MIVSLIYAVHRDRPERRSFRKMMLPLGMMMGVQMVVGAVVVNWLIAVTEMLDVDDMFVRLID